MSGPDEALGHDRITFVVDLEASTVHEPGPGAFDDPAFWECFEATGVDALDHLDADVVMPAVLDEAALEPRVAPQLGEASGAVAGTVGHGDPPALSEMDAATTATAMRSPRVSTMPKVLRPLTLFPASYPLVFLRTVGAARTERASMMPADGVASRPSLMRTAAASRSAMRSQVPSRDHSRW